MLKKISYLLNKLPNSYDAERGVLGGILIDSISYEKVYLLELKANDFYYTRHEIIFDSISSLYSEGEAINTITLIDRLSRIQKINEIGGSSFILALSHLFPSSEHVESYAKMIIDKSILRNLIHSSIKIIYSALFPKKNIDFILSNAQKKILSINTRNSIKEINPIGNYIKKAVEQIIKAQKSKGLITGISSGFVNFDKLTNGFHAGELIVIAARPSMGKTALTLNIASFISFKLKIPIAFFSLEMGAFQLIQRILSSETKIDLLRLKNGLLNHKELLTIIQIAKNIGYSNLFIDETPNLTISDLQKRCRIIVHKYKIKIIIIDYLQLMQSSTRKDSKTMEITEISQGLKTIARELSISIITVSQLNRSVENRINKRPIMSDLRESGAIEQDADVVIFLYREEYYLRDETPFNKRGISEIIISKNRNGPIGSFLLKFQNNITKFINIENADADKKL